MTIDHGLTDSLANDDMARWMRDNTDRAESE
jgi:hypothetical protein